MLDLTINFLREIGLNIEAKPIPDKILPFCFLEGILSSNGLIWVDPKIAHAGNLLHEAGHFAVLPRRFRPFGATTTFSSLERLLEKAAENDINPTEQEMWILMHCDDLAAQGWSFAAAAHLGIPTYLPFELGFDGIGLEIHEAIVASIGLKIGCQQSVALFYAKMLESKQAFPNLKYWLNAV